MTNYRNTVLYTGVTSNLEKRIYEHKSEMLNKSFSKRYKLYKLLWTEEFSTPEEAISVEKKIKGWNRNKKISLIRKNNPLFKDLMGDAS